MACEPRLTANFDGEPMQSVESEMSVLGAMLLSQKACLEVVDLLERSDFYTPVHGEIYQAFLKLMEAKTEIDLVTVKNALGDRLEFCGGVEYLMQLGDAVPTASNARYYAGIVREKADLRRIDLAARNMAKLARAGDFTGATLAAGNALKGVRTKSGEVSVSEGIRSAKTGPARAVPCFLPSVNAAMKSGGFARGQAHGFCAASGTGKTTFLCQQLAHACDLGHSVALVTLEMSWPELAQKIMQQLTGYWSEDHAARTGDDAHAEYQAAQLRVETWDLHVFDKSQDFRNGAKLSEVFGWLTRIAETKGLDMCLIDYVQLIAADNPRNQDFQHHHDLAAMMTEWAKTHHVANLGLYQIRWINGKMEFKGGDKYRDASASILVRAMGKKDEDGHTPEYLVIEKNRFRVGPSAVKIETFYDQRTETISE